MDIKFYPYEDLEMKSNNGDVQLKTPWIELNIKLDPQVARELQDIYNNFQNEVVKAEEVIRFSQFLEKLRRYPIYYILPFSKEGDSYNVDNKRLINGELETLIFELSQSKEFGREGFKKEDLEGINLILKSRESHWDYESILNFSNINGRYCPESILTAVRKFHMMEMKEGSGVENVYSKIRNLPAKEQKEIAARMIRQNHYVTSRCISCVEPALNIAQSSKSEVEDFIKEERGHDIIMEKAIEASGFEASKLPVTLKARVIMDLLQFAASTNYLAFAILIDFFERSNFSGKDPLGELLSDIGLKDSAKLVNRHLQINEMGEHDSVSLDLLKKVGLVSQDYLKEALAIGELTSVFSNGLANQTLQDYYNENL